MQVTIDSIYAIVGPSADPNEVKAHAELRWIGGRQELCWRLGTVITGPEAWKLVGYGLATPHDEEAKAKCQCFTPAMIAEAKFGLEMTYKGIPLHAKAAYRAGIVDSYDPDTDSYQLGSNAGLIAENHYGLHENEVEKIKEQLNGSVD